MADEGLNAKWLLLLYSKRAFSPVRRVLEVILFLSPPRGGLDLVTNRQVTGCHLIGVYRVPRAGLEVWLGVHITIVSGLFVVVVASTGPRGCCTFSCYQGGKTPAKVGWLLSYGLAIFF